jgi:hypothetical protein
MIKLKNSVDHCQHVSRNWKSIELNEGSAFSLKSHPANLARRSSGARMRTIGLVLLIICALLLFEFVFAKPANPGYSKNQGDNDTPDACDN